MVYTEIMYITLKNQVFTNCRKDASGYKIDGGSASTFPIREPARQELYNFSNKIAVLEQSREKGGTGKDYPRATSSKKHYDAYIASLGRGIRKSGFRNIVRTKVP